MADAMTNVLEDSEAAPPGSGVVARRATRLDLVNAIRGQQVMLSLTGPPADLEVAAWLADAILDQLPEALAEAEPASLNSASAEPDHSAALVRRECAEEIRNEADKVESRGGADPARLRTYADGMRRAAAVLLLGQRAEEAKIP